MSAAELDNILCILDRFWLIGKIAFWEGGDFDEESRDLLACSGGMMHQTCRRMANLQDTCWSTETAKVEVGLQGDRLAHSDCSCTLSTADTGI